MDIFEFTDKVKSIDVWGVLKEVLNNHLAELIDANTEQLRKGELNDSEFLERYKSPIYYEFKKTLATYKAPDGVPDLFLTGAFQEKFYAEIRDEGIYFDSTDSKTNELEWMYSKDIFGIQPEKMGELMAGVIIPEFTVLFLNKILN